MPDISGLSRLAAVTALTAMLGSIGSHKTFPPKSKHSAGFMAASMPKSGKLGRPGPPREVVPGIQGIYALCEVTGGGQKVYGIAIEYDTNIEADSLLLDTYTAAVFLNHNKGFPPPFHDDSKDDEKDAAKTRAVTNIYTNSEPSLRSAHDSIKGFFVIVEFDQDDDLSLPTRDSDKVSLKQSKSVKTLQGGSYETDQVWTNSGRRGNNVITRGVDAWEQHHWWWDDEHAAWLEYSIFLPSSFLAEGGEKKDYPLVLAITHSGTSIDGTCAETLTEQCIASIWSLPEEQEKHECVVITPRYERTTMNDYWEHTCDVENTHRLVESLLENTWDYGNPNLVDRCDKVLRIDRNRVYCTGWSMGAMTSLWLMSKHPDTYAAGLIIAGQQRPRDVVNLAKQKVLIITGDRDQKATPWNEKCLPVWEKAGGVVVRPSKLFNASQIFPVDKQEKLTADLDQYLDKDANVSFFTFAGVDHMESARKFFYINAAKNWLFRQTKA